MSIYVS